MRKINKYQITLLVLLVMATIKTNMNLSYSHITLSLLPKTGSSGSVLYFLIGGALILIAIVVLVMGKKDK